MQNPCYILIKSSSDKYSILQNHFPNYYTTYEKALLDLQLDGIENIHYLDEMTNHPDISQRTFPREDTIYYLVDKEEIIKMLNDDGQSLSDINM